MRNWERIKVASIGRQDQEIHFFKKMKFLKKWSQRKGKEKYKKETKTWGNIGDNG